jgi:hypothetical protein
VLKPKKQLFPSLKNYRNSNEISHFKAYKLKKDIHNEDKNVFKFHGIKVESVEGEKVSDINLDIFKLSHKKINNFHKEDGENVNDSKLRNNFKFEKGYKNRDSFTRSVDNEGFCIYFF